MSEGRMVGTARIWAVDRSSLWDNQLETATSMYEFTFYAALSVEMGAVRTFATDCSHFELMQLLQMRCDRSVNVHA